jgi:hypothetical protein
MAFVRGPSHSRRTTDTASAARPPGLPESRTAGNSAAPPAPHPPHHKAAETNIHTPHWYWSSAPEHPDPTPPHGPGSTPKPPPAHSAYPLDQDRTSALAHHSTAAGSPPHRTQTRKPWGLIPSGHTAAGPTRVPPGWQPQSHSPQYPNLYAAKIVHSPLHANCP